MSSRSYEVTSMEVLPKLDAFSDVVIKINFTYGDDRASLVGSCSLPAPEGQFIPLDSISKETALQWLLANCENTTEEFNEQLDAEIAADADRPYPYTWPVVDPGYDPSVTPAAE